MFFISPYVRLMPPLIITPLMFSPLLLPP